MSLLLKLENLLEGSVVKRPSKFIKSPYVADISILNQNTDTILGHTASLGCCGLADAGATVLMSLVPLKKKKDGKLSCEYRVYLSVILDRDQEIVVGIHQKLAENLEEAALKAKLLSDA